MINIFKAGGAWKTEEGKEYTVKTVNESTLRKHLSDGWVRDLSEALKESEKELTPAEKAAITKAKNKEKESE